MKSTIKILSVGLLIVSLLCSTTFAQSPEKMSYQAVIRDAEHYLISNQDVALRLQIIQRTVNDSVIYKETHLVTTNAIGLVSLEIGSGDVSFGVFNAIDWGNGTYFVKTEIDPTGETLYTITDTSQLMSVPYALHANTAESFVGEISSLETDPRFETSIATAITAADIAHWNNHTVDTDTQLDEATVDAFVANNGYLVGEVDGSITNEIEIPTGGESGQVLQTDGQGNYSWVYQPTNTDHQNISGSSLTGTILTIGITGGDSEDIDLSTLGSGDGDAWGVIGEDIATDIGRTGRVGIGTVTPSHKLHVEGNAIITEMAAASFTDSIVFTSSEGEIRQMSVDRHTNHIVNSIFSPSVGNLVCTGITPYGVYIKRLPLDMSYYISVEINVTTAGSYTISSDTLNGYYFYKQAFFFNTGLQHTNVPGFGNPVDAQRDEFTLTYGNNECPFNVDVIGDASGELICSVNLVGTYFNPAALDGSTNYIEIDLNFLSSGNWSVTTDELNGYSFSGAGSVVTSGNHRITIVASGLPANIQTDEFTITLSNSTATCPVSVNVIDIYRSGTNHCANGRANVVNVLSPITGKLWMDRNLGASQVAQTKTDAFAYGDLYQSGRFADGHQCRNSGITGVLSEINNPSHDNFITGDIENGNDRDWRSTPARDLWQDEGGINNPCPIGYRIPTKEEFNAEISSFTNINDAFTSFFKFPAAGFRKLETGGFGGVTEFSYYWSGTYPGPNDMLYSVGLRDVSVSNGPQYGSYGFSVRCIKN